MLIPMGPIALPPIIGPLAPGPAPTPADDGPGRGRDGGEVITDWGVGRVGTPVVPVPVAVMPGPGAAPGVGEALPGVGAGREACNPGEADLDGSWD